MQIVKGTQLSIAYVRGQFPRSSDERNCIHIVCLNRSPCLERELIMGIIELHTRLNGT